MKVPVPQLNDSWKSHTRYLFHLLSRIIFWLAILWVVLWVYDAVGNNRYASRIYVNRANQYDIVAFGDSLVEGLGSEDLVGFVGRLESSIGKPIYNAGHRRDQTKDLLVRLDQDVLSLNPKIVIMVIGGNDAVRFVPEEQMLSNLEELFRRLTQAGITVIFGEVTDDILFSGRNAKMRALAEKYHVHYVAGLMKNVFWTLSNKFDILHPDDAGYQIMADRILPVLKQAVEQTEEYQ